MGYALFSLALGAILRWGVADQIKGVNLAAIGTILMVVGLVGVVLSLFEGGMRRRREMSRTVSGPGGTYTVDESHRV